MAQLMTLDVPEVQVLVHYPGDAAGLDWHHRVSVASSRCWRLDHFDSRPGISAAQFSHPSSSHPGS